MQDIYNLDVATPEEVPCVLDAAADRYRESDTELMIAWQDGNAGKVWADIASILNRAAESCRRAIRRRL
jgi:hypothetical protein